MKDKQKLKHLRNKLLAHNMNSTTFESHSGGDFLEIRAKECKTIKSRIRFIHFYFKHCNIEV